jgi:hypothetical protein
LQSAQTAAFRNKQSAAADGRFARRRLPYRRSDFFGYLVREPPGRLFDFSKTNFNRRRIFSQNKKNI